jgi:hypothetical protein
LNAATYRWLMLIAEFDRRRGWWDGSLHSCAHWLNFKCGLNLGAAREQMRVAHALPTVPKIAAAMARGEISYSKVRALTRVATPATEEALLMIAHHGTAYHVESIVSKFRRAQQAEELSREAVQQAGRAVHYGYDTDGSLVLKARLPALAGALVIKALESAMESPKGEAPPREERPSLVSRRADALAVIAESYLQSPQALSTADRFQVVVHADAETLRERSAGRCHVEHGPSVPAESVRRLTCDASVVPVLETEEGEVLDVGRKTRTIPAAIRRALNLRDPGCCFPGCTHRRYLDAHHVKHWIDGGETKLSNLVSLCRTHHRLVHEGGITISVREAGGWRFVRPDGRAFDDLRDSRATHYDGTELHATHAALGLPIDRKTAACRWQGERMDYELGVWVLCNHVKVAKRKLSAETSRLAAGQQHSPRPDEPDNRQGGPGS